ncbi:MAG TPA: tRNA lysidine(34) synthetase TilS, partial [Vicinamibacterales bacterium]|nr:tRNA lysidine(34) synthetase TilS [Vicinamibacterales bacterium]
MNIAARVRRYVDRHQLWLGGGRVVAAVSGGSDSVSLLWILKDLHDAGAVSLAGVAHLNHQLRTDAAKDEAFCRALAERAGTPFVAARSDIAALAREWRCSVEVAARRARYSFLEQARRAYRAEHIAVAHTRDDQAETVVMRLLRGTGTRGLRGALPARGHVVRPLLDCSRAELRSFLAARGEAWVEDETNADLGHPRNRVRHELLPLLARSYRPSVTRILARTADVAAYEDALLEQLATDALAPLLDARSGAWRLDAAGFRRLPV